MARISTHVLDTALGQPAQGMQIELLRVEGELAGSSITATTNAEGRTDEPLLAAPVLAVGKYRLLFHVGKYFKSRGTIGGGEFLDIVTVDFIVSDATTNYHIPLLVSPWSYTTYRGS